MQPVARTIEAGLTVFSAAEIRVVLLPVGEAPEAAFQRYASLIVQHRQVELNNVRSFYKEAQKSPFKFFPWKSGNMHFKFLPEELALQTSALAPLHSHRRVLGVIGIMHCPNVEDVSRAYAQFEQRCKAFPDAFTVRCFAFEPSDEQIQEDRKGQRNFIMFPPGDSEQLDNHAEVVMHDFAACLLAELERWMLTASPAMVDLASLVDSPEFLGASGALEAVQTRLYSDEELKTKKRYGRLQKAMGDHCLLAGSPLDAQDHYSTAVELGRTTQDWIYLAAALEGFAAAKILSAAIQHGAFAINRASVFRDEEQWRTPRKGSAATSAAGDDARSDGSHLSEASRSSSAFGGSQFWAALRGVDRLETEVRGLFSEARASVRRRGGGQPLLVEGDLKLGRFLAGLHGSLARREVSELVTGLQVLAETLTLPEDRLLTFVEGAQLLGLVGSARKRVLLLWQAVELSKFLGFPNTRTLDVARKALEPPDDPREPDSEADIWAKGRPLAQSAVPLSWPQVRAGCLEAVLGLAIYAKQHADVWDAAAALLREHSGELSGHRMQSLLENLLAAASQMGAADKNRPGPGPPPLLYFLAPRPPPLPQRPVQFTIGLRLQGGGSGANGALVGRPGSGPFLYDPFSAKREQAAAAKSQEAAAGPVQWVCGEVASVEVEVSNPAAVGMRVDKMVLEATYLGDASMAPKEYMTITSSTQAAWKPKPVSLNIPANTKPVRIVLEGTPLLKGMLVLTGCRLTAFGGVSWVQPWSSRPPSIAQQLAYATCREAAGAAGGEASSATLGGSGSGPAGGGSGGAGAGGGSDGAAAPEARVVVVEPLPLVQMGLRVLGDVGGGQQGPADGLGMLPPAGGANGSAESGGGGGAAAGGARALRLLQGQVYAAELTVTNVSKVPVGWASFNVRQKEPRNRLSVAVDSAALLAQLPLAAGQSALVPMTISAGVRATHQAEEVFTSEVCLEAVSRDTAEPLLQGSGSADGGGADSSSKDGSGEQPAGGGAGAPAAAATTATVLGRHAVLPVQVHVQPSVQVSQVSFREMYLPAAAQQGASAGSGSSPPSSSSSSSRTFERRCVMEVSLANRGRWPLQVWLGPSVADPSQLAAAAAQDMLLPPPLPAGAEGLPTVASLAPGRRCTVACLLDASHACPGSPCAGELDTSGSGSSAGGAALSAGPAAASGGVSARPAASWEVQERQACAERLSQSLALFYRVDSDETGLADAAVGTAPLVHGEVFNGLDWATLARLQPCAVTVSLTAEPLQAQQAQQAAAAAAGGEDGREQQVQQQAGAPPLPLQLVTPPEPAAAAGHQQQHQQQQAGVAGSPYGRFPAFEAPAGQPLSVTLTVTNHGRTVPGGSEGAGGAAAGHGAGGEAAAAGSPAAAGLELACDASVGCHPVLSGEQQGEAGAGPGAGGSAGSHELTAVWAGQLWTGLRLVVPPGQTVSQRLGLCLLAPGLYRISLQDWRCRPVLPPALAAAAAAEQQAEGRGGRKGAPAPWQMLNTLVSIDPCYVLCSG